MLSEGELIKESPRRPVSQVRAVIVYQCSEESGLSAAEIARQLGGDDAQYYPTDCQGGATSGGMSYATNTPMSADLPLKTKTATASDNPYP